MSATNLTHVEPGQKGAWVLPSGTTLQPRQGNVIFCNGVVFAVTDRGIQLFDETAHKRISEYAAKAEYLSMLLKQSEENKAAPGYIQSAVNYVKTLGRRPMPRFQFQPNPAPPLPMGSLTPESTPDRNNQGTRPAADIYETPTGAKESKNSNETEVKTEVKPKDANVTRRKSIPKIHMTKAFRIDIDVQLQRLATKYILQIFDSLTTPLPYVIDSDYVNRSVNMINEILEEEFKTLTESYDTSETNFEPYPESRIRQMYEEVTFRKAVEKPQEDPPANTEDPPTEETASEDPPAPSSTSSEQTQTEPTEVLPAPTRVPPATPATQLPIYPHSVYPPNPQDVPPHRSVQHPPGGGRGRPLYPGRTNQYNRVGEYDCRGLPYETRPPPQGEFLNTFMESQRKVVMEALLEKIDPFDGSDPSKAFPFIDCVEEVASKCDLDHILTAEMKLRGKADEIMKRKRQNFPNGLTWTNWKNEFLQELSDTPHEVDAKLKIEKVKQGDNETVKSYVSRCVLLLSRLHKTGNLTNMPTENHLYLIKGLKNQRFKRAVANKNLDSCRNMQEIISKIDEVEQQWTRRSRYEDSSDEEPRSGDQDDPSENVDEVRFGKSYKGKYSKYKGKYDKYSDKRYKKYNGKSSGQGYGKGSDYTNLICGFCEKKGHKIMQCKRMMEWKKFSKMPKGLRTAEIEKLNSVDEVGDQPQEQQEENNPDVTLSKLWNQESSSSESD